MNEELEKKFAFIRDFKIKGFTNLKIERIIVCEEISTNNIVFVYIKIDKRNWQKYFLDVGGGFWDNCKTKDYTKLIDIEDCENFIFKDYTEKLNAENKIISKTYCKPNEENCQIIIEIENKERIILKCKDPKLFDSVCEIIRD